MQRFPVNRESLFLLFSGQISCDLIKGLALTCGVCLVVTACGVVKTMKRETLRRKGIMWSIYTLGQFLKLMLQQHRGTLKLRQISYPRLRGTGGGPRNHLAHHLLCIAFTPYCVYSPIL